ncbi:hypothetical protein AZI85_03930 [Bdellovibrio bacteriovorus]|uniref:J domain-containing protein n=1 Tax=Bdellovibrio bacteriovorus TaxID=959 RepID=A0A150WKX0_BDEBC|nr:hypothetical protein [Bdellovibrio bacteriovorus]KYG64568.1 hypothetical protein AZI85_03930 [Bdellovibrio bacteriovorus]
MNSQDFLTLNLVGAGAFIFWYLLSRGGSRRPTQLNMGAKDSAPPLITAEEPSQALEPLRRHPDLTQAQVKSLNVMFNYNGHTWDAYEVLGVPAGASIKLVTEAYQVALRRCDKESMEFIETAYRAILNKGA